MDKRGGEGGREYHNFLSKFLCLTVPKNIVGEPFSVSLFSGIQKSYASEGYVTIFRRNFLTHSAEKFRWVEPFSAVFQKISGSEKVYG